MWFKTRENKDVTFVKKKKKSGPKLRGTGTRERTKHNARPFHKHPFLVENGVLTFGSAHPVLLRSVVRSNVDAHLNRSKSAARPAITVRALAARDTDRCIMGTSAGISRGDGIVVQEFDEFRSPWSVFRILGLKKAIRINWI